MLPCGNAADRSSLNIGTTVRGTQIALGQEAHPPRTVPLAQQCRDLDDVRYSACLPCPIAALRFSGRASQIPREPRGWVEFARRPDAIEG